MLSGIPHTCRLVRPRFGPLSDMRKLLEMRMMELVEREEGLVGGGWLCTVYVAATVYAAAGHEH